MRYSGKRSNTNLFTASERDEYMARRTFPAIHFSESNSCREDTEASARATLSAGAETFTDKAAMGLTG